MTASTPPDARARAQHVQRLFEAAVDLEPGPRGEFLAASCAGDHELREEVEALLAGLAQAQTGALLPPLFPTNPPATAVAQAPLLVGQRIANYEVVASIAQGGMGAVYLARHRFIDKRAALKILHAELSRHGEMVQRFLNEARAANAIRHPNIIEVSDAGVMDDGTPYILMEYLEGESLGARLRAGRLPIAEIVRIGCETAEALAAAHDRGIIHRDLKPENLFLARRDEGPALIKVLDFGIAKLRADIAAAFTTGAGQEAAPTHAGTLLGTPQYMSPEQCRDVSKVDHRSDVYSLGVILYEMACGQLPFVSSSGSLGDLLYQHITEIPVSPRDHAPDLPPALEAVILQCLAKDPALRFASMRALSAALAGSVTASRTAPTMIEAPAGRPRRGLARLALTAVFVAAAAVSAGVVLWRRAAAPHAVTSLAPPAAPVSPALAASPPSSSAPAPDPVKSPVKPAEGKPTPARPARRSDIPDILKKNPY